jgi:hypothetical protein
MRIVAAVLALIGCLAGGMEPCSADDPATMRFWLEVKPAQRIVAVLTADITHPDTDKIDEGAIFAPQVPNLPGQKDVKTTFNAKAMIVQEEGPLKRPLFLARFSDGRKTFHIVLTVEATLMSRKLRPLTKGQAVPKVADLSAEAVKWYTRYSWDGVLEPNPKPFREWLAKVGLKRKAGEGELVFAYRAFQYIQRHFGYKYPPDDRSLAAVCASGQSDCGGLSGLFVAVMRENGVPARALTGRMAASGGLGHVRAEFFARGVGWVPVDAAAAVSDSNGSTFDFFGNDPGDLLALSHDPMGKTETFVAGNVTAVACQGLGYWWRGTGKGEKLRWDETWTVKKETMVQGPGWVPLFNGKNLTGWNTYSSHKGKWEVKGGAITASGALGYLFSDAGDYDNFHIRIEAKINAQGDSGLFFRCQPGPDHPKGYEAQIDVSTIASVKTGSLYPAFNPKLTAEQRDLIIVGTPPHKADEWFTQEVIADGNFIVIKVNGQITAAFVDKNRTYTKGHFAIQHLNTHTVVQVRKVEVRRLVATEQGK